MMVSLHTWTAKDRDSLMALCNAVDRTFLSDRLPYPYTEADADWWLGMVEETKAGAVVKGGKAMDVRVFIAESLGIILEAK